MHRLRLCINQGGPAHPAHRPGPVYLGRPGISGPSVQAKFSAWVTPRRAALIRHRPIFAPGPGRAAAPPGRAVGFGHSCHSGLIGSGRAWLCYAGSVMSVRAGPRFGRAELHGAGAGAAHYSRVRPCKAMMALYGYNGVKFFHGPKNVTQKVSVTFRFQQKNWG